MIPAREEISNTDSLSALIVDDSPLIRAILKRVLSSYSIECDQARDGREAIAAVERRLREQHPYDLVCLDLGIPEMDGHAVLLCIRSAESRFQATAPAYIIVLTAEDNEETVNRMFSDGANAYILKPFNRESFRSHVERIIIRRSSRTRSAPG